MPTISVAMIVKNEAADLTQCLDTVKDWVDEIIIVDFRTDAVDNEQKLIDLYTIQLQTYKKAMKKLTNLPINTYIYAFPLSKGIYLE